MKRVLALGLALAVGLIAEDAIEALRLRGGAPVPREEIPIPPVSSPPASPASPLDATLAADIEIEGRRFRVFVGQNAGDGTREASVWSVVIPADE
jgi:hypothetical protein